MKKLAAISLYTGAGGLDFGFEAAGFRTAVAIEMDDVCVRTLRLNRSWPVICGDINSVTTRRILAKAKLRRGEADVLIGGPPCQPFSKSGFWATGSTKRLDDPRASTLENYMRVLEEAKPRAFLLENVEGLGLRGKDEGLQHIRGRLDEINARQGTNYRPFTAVLNAADFGVPQLRRRFFVIGAPSKRRRRTRSPIALARSGIVTNRVNEMWGTDMTQTITVAEGRAYVFVAVEHANSEVVGIHAARSANRFEALSASQFGVSAHSAARAPRAAT